ncbi:MAG: hypothetical protein K6C31_04230 [Bacteroidales bacterium]|nr:hypothetical protein [Bacteroidales bacterium]
MRIIERKEYVRPELDMLKLVLKKALLIGSDGNTIDGQEEDDFPWQNP